MIQGPQKQCFRVSDLQIHKYTITALVKVADRHDMCYIFEKVMIPDLKNNVLGCLTCKYTNTKNTNTQIHK